MITDLVIDFMLIGALIGSMVFSMRAPRPAASRSSATNRRPAHARDVRTARPFRRAEAWDGVAEVRWHRAPREVAARRDVAERLGLALT